MAQGDSEIQAIQALIDALDPLEADARERVLDYAFKRLGLTAVASRPTLLPPTDPAVATPEPASTGSMGAPAQLDIRTLREEKQPQSANDMAALVGYYLSEVAPPDERKDEIGTAEIEKYFKQGGQQLPQTPSYTLKNAAAAGYFDPVSRGVYKLNPVGYNLVVHGLPRDATKPGRRTSRPKRGGAKRATKARIARPAEGARAPRKSGRGAKSK